MIEWLSFWRNQKGITVDKTVPWKKAVSREAMAYEKGPRYYDSQD